MSASTNAYIGFFKQSIKVYNVAEISIAITKSLIA